MTATADTLRHAASLLNSGQAAQAEELCCGLLLAQPDNAQAHSLLGVLKASRGECREAIASFDRALSLRPDPDVAQARANLLRALAALAESGRLLIRQGRPEAALAEYARLLALDPENADAHNGRGVALRSMRQYAAASACFAAALQHRENDAAAANNYGLTLHDLGRSEEAAAFLGRALAQHPQHRSALHNLGMILHSIDRHEEAAQVYVRLVDIAPDHDYAAGSLARARLSCCEWSDIDSDVARVRQLLSSGARPADGLSALMMTGQADVQLECSRRFSAREYPASGTPLWRGERYGHDRIRIAYLSADFHDHPVAHLLAGVLEHHDRQHFEVIGVSLRREASPGAMHQRLRRAFERFHDVLDSSDQHVAELLRAWEIDIAVDLTGLTRGGRLGILAHRPAPVQVNFLGFAGSYGAPYIDYVIADPVVVRAGDEAHFTEHIVRLPRTFLPNDDAQAVAGDLTRAEVGLPETGFVYCAFSNCYKINPPLFDVWMRLLRETPDSVLWLRTGSKAFERNISGAAAARGVAPGRLVFAPKIVEMQRHLARYRLADLFLDTSPYGAHATARDALWAGLPVLTLAGGCFASRVAASLLTALELPELVTLSLDEYLERARSLAGSPSTLATLRARVAARGGRRGPFDTLLFRRELESAYRAMWERTERGEDPCHIDVPADD